MQISGFLITSLIYFTSITLKTHGTYKHVLEGGDVGVGGPTWTKPENMEKTTELGWATTTLLHAYTLLHLWLKEQF